MSFFGEFHSKIVLRENLSVMVDRLTSEFDLLIIRVAVVDATIFMFEEFGKDRRFNREVGNAGSSISRTRMVLVRERNALTIFPMKIVFNTFCDKFGVIRRRTRITT